MRHTARQEGNCDRQGLCLSILQMTLSVTIYFPAHCGHTGSPDWGGVSQRAACGWSHVHVDSGPVRSCGPVPFAGLG